MDQSSPITSSIDEISLREKSKTKFKASENATERVKRQKSEFFSLLTTQLRNQDPLSPMDTSQMTQQIFAINSVEQSLETNKHLEDIKGYFAMAQNANYMGYIDKIVHYPSNSVLIEKGIGEFRYEILDQPSNAKIQIRDSSNTVVHVDNLPVKQGFNVFMWKKPENLPDGIYSFNVTADMVDGNKANVKTYGSGRVGGILSQDGTQKFEVNGHVVPLEDITKISNSTAGHNIMNKL